MTGGEKTGNAQRDRAAKGLAASLLLHLLFFVLLGAAAMRLEQSRPSDPIYDVALIGAPGSSAPAPATAPVAPPAVQDDVILSGGRRIAAPTGFWLTGLCLYGRIELPERAGANNKRAGGCSYISERGWKEMRIILNSI